MVSHKRSEIFPVIPTDIQTFYESEPHQMPLYAAQNTLCRAGVCLPKRWNSSCKGRIDILERFFRLFVRDSIKILDVDREFVGNEWFICLTTIPFSTILSSATFSRWRIPEQVKIYWLNISFPISKSRLSALPSTVRLSRRHLSQSRQTNYNQCF